LTVIEAELPLSDGLQGASYQAGKNEVVINPFDPANHNVKYNNKRATCYLVVDLREMCVHSGQLPGNPD
jgi:hypothetical protein